MSDNHGDQFDSAVVKIQAIVRGAISRKSTSNQLLRYHLNMPQLWYNTLFMLLYVYYFDKVYLIRL